MAFLDLGRSGANDLTQNDIEELPGQSNDADHVIRRPRVCAMCGIFQGREQKRVKNLSETANITLRQQLTDLMEHWNVSDQRLPCGLCYKCSKALSRIQHETTGLSMSKLKYADEIYANRTKSRQLTAGVCPGSDCVVCHSSPRNVRQQHLQRPDNLREKQQSAPALLSTKWTHRNTPQIRHCHIHL